MTGVNPYKKGDLLRLVEPGPGKTGDLFEVVGPGAFEDTVTVRSRVTGEEGGWLACRFEPATTNSILDTAKQLIEGSRAEEYGSFAHNAKQQADLWNAYLSDGKGGIREIADMDVPAMMILVKLMRLSGNTSHQDSWVDVAGFAGLAEQVMNG
jgi:hypothetical protein